MRLRPSPDSILDLQHHLFTLTFDGKLYLCPIPEKVDRVLDVGTGMYFSEIFYSIRVHEF